jgi:putative membrane protein
LVTRLTAAEKARIHAALAGAESRTHVHVAVSIIPASDRYLLYPVAWGAIVALVSGGVLAIGWPHFSLREAFAIEAIVFVGLSILFEWWPLRLMLVPRTIRRHRAEALARREFAARILASSERRGGVLLFVSLGERYAEILADRETHARIGSAAWETIIRDYVAAVKSRPLADALVAAIEACAAILQRPPATA